MYIPVRSLLIGYALRQYDLPEGVDHGISTKVDHHWLDGGPVAAVAAAICAVVTWEAVSSLQNAPKNLRQTKFAVNPRSMGTPPEVLT